MVRRRLVLMVLLMSALLSADGARDYKDALKRWKKTDKHFWQEFKTDWKNAYLTLRDPLEKAQAKPKENKDAVRDYSDVEALYKAYEEAEKERGAAAAAYALSGEAKALETLFKELLNLGKAVNKLEKELDDGKPNRGRYIFDQSVGIRRHALGVRQIMLPKAIAQATGAAEFLADAGWAQATKKDGKASIVRRVGVIDAIAALPTDQRAAAKTRLLETLKAPQSSLRVAAVDALAAWEGAGVEPLLETLTDQNPIVRRATLEVACDPRFIKPVLDALADAEGLERAEQLAVLHRLTKQKFGTDVAAWKEWYEAYADEIEAGKFDVESVEEQEVEKGAEPETISFFGVKTMSHRIGFALEASFMLEIPAEVEFQRTRYIYDWYGSNPSWRKGHPSHQMALFDQLQQTLGGWPPEASFTLSLLHQNFRVTSFGAKRKPLGGNVRDIKDVLKKIEKLRGNGWCSQYEGIKEAMRIGRMPKGAIDFPNPHTDTIFLWGVGGPRGGRFMWFKAAADAVARLNRFRRVRIHALRIGYEQETGAALMEAIAKRTGGTYVWLKEPPGSD